MGDLKELVVCVVESGEDMDWSVSYSSRGWKTTSSDSIGAMFGRKLFCFRQTFESLNYIL